jgi:intracellular multiplication protein IcmJ
MKELFLSFANPVTWRTAKDVEKLDQKEWRELRQKILQRDNYTCRYCGFQAEKFQIVHHIDGNPANNDEDNLETICQMCNLIHHAGQGCVVQGIVDLYEESSYSQNEIIIITRRMRAQGKRDEEIIRAFGLKKRAPFKMDRGYLKNLFGFVTSRGAKEDQFTNTALSYIYHVEKSKEGR